MPSASEPPACLACGACCFSHSERYVPVTGDDHARLGDEAERLTVFIGNRCFMRMEHEHCAALSVEASGRFVCGSYELRPDVCRELARGGPACSAELTLKRESARHALQVVQS